MRLVDDDITGPVEPLMIFSHFSPIAAIQQDNIFQITIGDINPIHTNHVRNEIVGPD